MIPAEAHDASPPIRPRSINDTGTPRSASSKAMPLPMTPPPTTTTAPDANPAISVTSPHQIANSADGLPLSRLRKLPIVFLVPESQDSVVFTEVRHITARSSIGDTHGCVTS